jgi:ATP/maltotriose-dependent transcriptional regulator MalT
VGSFGGGARSGRGPTARALFLGENTVKTHVGYILDKLHLRHRVQAVILAYEIGLMQPGDSGT